MKHFAIEGEPDLSLLDGLIRATFTTKGRGVTVSVDDENYEHAKDVLTIQGVPFMETTQLNPLQVRAFAAVRDLEERLANGKVIEGLDA